jgi:urease accessory protein UreH
VRAGGRTVLRRVRFDGVLRCSRAFDRGGAALVITSQLGPGVVHGDRLELRGTLDADARLIVTAQAATRVLGGKRSASSDARWEVGPGARLQLIGEPLVASPDGRYVATQRIALGRGARVLVSDAACGVASAEVRLRTVIDVDGVEALYDAVDIDRAAPTAFGTLALFGLDRDGVERATAVLDELCTGLLDARAGVGTYPSGVLVRIIADSVWPVYDALARMRTALQTFLLDDSAASDGARAIHLSNDAPFSSRYHALKT